MIGTQGGRVQAGAVPAGRAALGEVRPEGLLGRSAWKVRPEGRRETRRPALGTERRACDVCDVDVLRTGVRTAGVRPRCGPCPPAAPSGPARSRTRPAA